ncbi:ASCH domain-containing protein [Saccharibacillus sp. CPCC 101409]|uniref:ASCH domain-containing protein n=1 Tax=Saccharibacillus sp. CPCC 101409 TaxID=3058041 RepID=UPI002673A397|nr:ASCH domain-containing protein [Saccharibacillus sp. CPCC 101409]MDO3410936.1 ASCH domain-containing protein [Saccharibacillus sp. CPCC 101409]
MQHSMTLFPEYFDSVCSGRKKVEVRLNDERRRAIGVGDTIRFECLPGRQRAVEVTVEALYKHGTFEELYRAMPFSDFDCEGWTMQEMVDGTYDIYTPEQEADWGALGIRIRRNAEMRTDKLIIEPGIGIGKLKLGMTRSEADEAVRHYVTQYKKDTNDSGFFENTFKLEYDRSGKVKFIEIVSEFKEFFDCTCYNVDVFNTKANELVQILSRISKPEADHEDETQYIFADIGLSLWRPSVFTEETMQEDWFQEMYAENQEQEMRYFYFQTAAVYADDGSYYN